MARFVVLSILLHVWVVLLFGDASGNRRDGRGWGRSFVATIDRLVVPARRAVPEVATPKSADVSAGNARAVSRTSEQLPTQSAPVVDVAATPAPAVAAPPLEKIPVLTNIVVPAVTPFAVAPIPLDPIATTSASASVALPAFATIAPIASVPQVAREEAGFAMFVAPIVERAAVSAVSVPSVATPTLPPLATSVADRDFRNYVPAPVIAPVADAHQQAAPTVSPAAPAQPLVAAYAPPTSQAQPVVPPPVYAGSPIEPLKLSPALATPEVYAPPAPRGEALVRAVESAPSVQPGALPGTEQTRGTPDTPLTSGERAGANVSAPQPASTTKSGPPTLLNFPLPLPITPALPAPTGPRLDLDALRRQAREVGREGSGPRTLLPFATVAKEAPKKDIEKIFDKALTRPDCKDAYADLGLAAVIPLVRDAVKDGGCKW